MCFKVFLNESFYLDIVKICVNVPNAYCVYLVLFNQFNQAKYLRVLLTSAPDIETPMISEKMWIWSHNQYYPSW